MASKELGPGGVEIWRSRGGLLRLRCPAPGIIEAGFSGDMPEDLAPPYAAYLQQIVAQTPRVAVFVDAEHLVNYETGFRQRCTQAHKAGGARIEAFHVFVVSRLAALGFQAINLILRNMVTHTSRAAFEAELSKTIAERVRSR